jgi:hypothetical protein
LRHCATNRKVAGSISDGVIDLFLLAALWSWVRLSLYTEMSTRVISLGVKTVGAYG